jgi:DNA polymerase (family 10)
LRRRNTTLSQIEILLAADKFINDTPSHQDLTVESIDENIIKGHFRTVPFSLYTCKMEESGSKQFMYTASESFMTEFLRLYPGIDFRNIREEKDVFKKVKLAFMEPELREDGAFLLKAATGKLPELIDFKDIKGVVHTHSLYSDGMNSIEEMADHALKLGYQYIGISDHSKSAAYANGLKEEKILEQWTEIEKLNRQFAPFRIFRGIESDILHDGSLDYSDEILQQFDFIIASVHSNLQMDEQKATARLIRAIENPYTTILGHPTGRLLLAREGYKPDFEKVMDACAANKVAIELNANPHRLDLDWSLIQKALDKGILISINPDAHSIQGLSDIHFGVLAARKGGLTRDSCLTCFDVADFADFIEKRKS